MVENLEHLIRCAAVNPRLPRTALFKELLRSETYLLTVDSPLEDGEVKRVTKSDASFPVWADKDPELGGVWVPVFPARDRVRDFVAARRLKTPKGKEFLWMGHMPGQVFSLLRGVRRFAGIKLFLDPGLSVTVPWTEVRALSEGRIADEGPKRYELPFERLVIPAGARLSFGKMKPWAGEEKPVLMLMPDAGKFAPEDLRRLVRLPLGEKHAWMPVRHFLQMMRRLQTLSGEGGRYLEDLFASLLSFEMYGEGEALCEWFEHHGHQAYAWVGLSAIYGRCGRMDECAELCVRALAKYPEERSFHVNGIRALAAVGRAEEASRYAAQAVRRFPGDEVLAGLRAKLTPAAAAR
ncbi:MAG: tetratricopeptide repeat protein [Elusimicrobia bacterium]|nr:tetratricopeptide repeat protein [Elusimicrobiota bacterium]